MDVQDGFILGIYNYCDRWCATCRFASRCRLFADGSEHEAKGDPELKAVIDAPPHPSDVRPTPAWLAQMLSEINVETTEQITEELAPRPEMPARLMRVAAFSRMYCDHVWTALDSTERSAPRPHDDPYSIILWFAPLISSKTYRALRGLNEFDGSRDYPPDHEGSAKVALIGIDRSMTAWADARTIGRVSADEASRFIDELHRLSFDLEELIPRAREFVRPGFDELDEVRKLEATDWS